MHTLTPKFEIGPRVWTSFENVVTKRGYFCLFWVNFTKCKPNLETFSNFGVKLSIIQKRIPNFGVICLHSKNCEFKCFAGKSQSRSLIATSQMHFWITRKNSIHDRMIHQRREFFFSFCKNNIYFFDLVVLVGECNSIAFF